MKVAGAVLLLIIAAAVPAAAQSASSQVSVTVSAVRLLEGDATVVVAASGLAQRGQLIVKSNTGWLLTARATGAASWRVAGTGSWTVAGRGTPLLEGIRGVHRVSYEVRAEAGTVLAFTLEPR